MGFSCAACGRVCTHSYSAEVIDRFLSHERDRGDVSLTGYSAHKGMCDMRLIFLDVDGVINDLREFISDDDDRYDNFDAHTEGRTFRIQLPKQIITPIQELVKKNEVRWLTTWREDANGDIREHLGIDPLLVVTDGTNDRFVEWKAPVAWNVAQEALNMGREVIWIEDFYGTYPEMPKGVRFIDTYGCLTPQQLKGLI